MVQGMGQRLLQTVSGRAGGPGTGRNVALLLAIAVAVSGCHWRSPLRSGPSVSGTTLLEATTPPPAPNPNSWITVAAPDNSYAIAFPQRPDWRTLPSIEAKYEDGERFYFVRSDRPPQDLPAASPDRARAYLEAAMPGVALLFGGSRIDYSEPIQLDRYPGQRLMFENASGIQFEARLFFDPQSLRLFVVAFGTTASNLAVPEAERFFNSFQILAGVPPNGPQAPNAPR